METTFLTDIIDRLLDLENDLDIATAVPVLERILDSLPFEELNDLISELTPDNEEEWLVRVDDLLGEIHESPDIERIREIFRIGFCFLRFIPRILYLIRAMLLYLLDILQYANYRDIASFRRQYQEGDILPSLYFKKIYSTVCCATLLNIILRISDLIGHSGGIPVEWEDLVHFLENGRVVEGTNMNEVHNLFHSFIRSFTLSGSINEFDRSTWEDFRSYLLTCENIFTPEPVVSTMCVLF